MKYYLAIFIALLTSTFTLAAYEPTIHTGTTENVSPRKVVHVMKQVDDTYGGIVVLEDGSAWRDYWEFKPISVGDTLESSDGIHFNNASDQVTYSLKYIGKIGLKGQLQPELPGLSGVIDHTDVLMKSVRHVSVPDYAEGTGGKASHTPRAAIEAGHAVVEIGRADG